MLGPSPLITPHPAECRAVLLSLLAKLLRERAEQDGLEDAGFAVAAPWQDLFLLTGSIRITTRGIVGV